MTVSSTLNKISYEGDGSNTTFNIPFYVLSENDLTFTLVNEETLAETSITDNFTLTAIDDKWPSVTSELLYPVLGDPIPIGYKLVIVREAALKQETAFSQNAAIQPAVVEQSLDKLVMMIQQQAEELTRCIKAGISSGIDPEVLIAQIIAAAASATSQAEIATAGANTATSQAEIATQAAATMTLATQAEAEAGTDNVKRMSPLRTLQEIVANIATQVQAEGGTDNTKLMTSLRTLQLLTVTLATQTEAEAGTDNTKIMTPLRVAESIAALVTIVPHGHAYFTASGTWTCPVGVTEVVVNACAGGGAGWDDTVGDPTAGGITSFGALLTLVGGGGCTSNLGPSGANGSLFVSLFGGKQIKTSPEQGAIASTGYGRGANSYNTEYTGGDGACAHEQRLAVTAGTVYTITIGAGGVKPNSGAVYQGRPGFMLIQW